MIIPRLRRLSEACRLVTITFFLSVASAPSVWADVSGLVVDQSARPVPRAYVRAVDNAGVELAAVFADEIGRFELKTDVTGCRVEASLTGFESATVPCSSGGLGQLLRLELKVAPIRETTIVTATRTEAPTSQVGASATVFTTEDLQRRQVPLVADLLMATPGAMLVRNGGPGTVTSLFVRGGESDYNKVLLDGVPLNEPGGTFYLNNLTTQDLERIEIVRGAYSSLFGSDAMASVIQLFTRRGDRAARPRLSAQIDGGTYHTFHENVSVSGGGARFDYSFGAARLDSDDRVPNSALGNTTLTANVGVQVGRTATLRFIGRGELERVGTPGTTAFGRPDLDASFERHDGVGSLSFDQQINRAVRQRASYSVSTSHQRSTDLIADPPYTAMFQGRVASSQSSDFLNDGRNDLRRHHASYQADWRLTTGARRGDHLLTLLGDWDGERSTQEDLLFPSRTANSRNNFGMSAQHQMLWPRIFVTIGGRIEHNDTFGTAAVPRGTAVFDVHQPSGSVGGTQIKVSAGTGIKEPTMFESFSLSPFARGNPSLKPERSRSVEAGIEQRIAHDRAKFELTYFHNRFSDIISLVTTNPSTFEGQYFNLGVTRARGLEAGVEVAPTAAIRAHGGYTLLDSKIVESSQPTHPLFGLGQQAFRRPRHSGFTGVALTWKRATADLNGVFIGKFIDSDFGLFTPPLVENPGHTTWDTRIAVTLTPRVTGTLAIDNLSDRDYSEPFGFQPLRRAIRAGLRVTY